MQKLLFLALAVTLLNAQGDVTSIPQVEFYKGLLGADPKQYIETGYVKLRNLDDDKQVVGEMFYHMFLKQGTMSLDQIKEGDIVAIWLNGGPGCSSQYGNFMELGPYQVSETEKDKFKVNERPQSWNSITHQLFVDQPLRVGMSSANGDFVVKDTETAAKYFVNFLRTLYTKHSILQRTQLYIMGESFAGHYIPAFSMQILIQKLTLVNFKGVAIGDGWTNPFQQFAYYASYLYNIGTITERQFKLIQANVALGQNALLDGNMELAYKQFDLLSDNQTIDMAGRINVYNFRQYQDQDIEDTTHERFLNFYLKSQFKAPDSKIKFEGCDDKTYNAFSLDVPTSRKSDIETLLNNNVRVLLFNGQLDYIVNTPGAIAWINQIDWPKINQWKRATKENIVVDGETQGTWKQYDNFMYATIYTAGHMVPTDNPKGAIAMIEKFLKVQ